MIRTRIAPSPTGNLHVGTARTALYNWLFARHNNGEFLLRIEDTDIERSDKKFEENIIDSLIWLGLNWDGEISRQSNRIDIYEKYIQKLLDEKKAFWCFHTKEELEMEKGEQMRRKEAPRHFCVHKNGGEQKTVNKKQAIIRLAVEERNELVIFDDIVRGPIQFNQITLGDISIAKDERTPLYNFAVVVDDHEMDISHVIRGEDHIANTPKQMLIAKSLGFESPQFAHIPIILAPDKSKLSKRHGAESVSEYRQMGFLPDAIVNYLALVGWRPPHYRKVHGLRSGDPQLEVKTKVGESEQEIFTRDELVNYFDLKDVHKGGAIFDIKKLRWMNGEYIRKLPPEELLELLAPFARKHFRGADGEQLKKVVPFFQERAETLDDISQFHYFFNDPEYSPDLLLWKQETRYRAKEALIEVLKITDSLDAAKLDKIAKEKFGGDRGAVYWPFRVALSGEKFSTPPIETFRIIGVETAKRRISSAIKKLE